MKYTNRLFDNISGEIKITPVGKWHYKLRHEDYEFTGSSLVKIVRQLKYLIRCYHKMPLRIDFDFGKVSFTDKTTIILLDAIMYHLLSNTNFNLCIFIKYSNHFFHRSLQSTAFMNSHNNGRINKVAFLNFYTKKLYINSFIYRRFIPRDEFERNPKLISLIFSEVSTFLQNSFINEERINSIGEIVAELCGNAKSHSDGDCLVDISTSNTVRRISTGECDLEGVSISIINLSDTNLNEKIKWNIKNRKNPENDRVYSNIYRAYENHKEFFDRRYTEDDFFNITTFQRHVSSRQLESGDSGTGLTYMLEELLGNTIDQFTYVLSGKKIVMFNQELIKVDDNGYIGFNREKDYISSKPDIEALDYTPFNIPGTIYHLAMINKGD